MLEIFLFEALEDNENTSSDDEDSDKEGQFSRHNLILLF